MLRPFKTKGHPAHRNRVAVQLARYLALHLVNVVVTLAWGSDTLSTCTIKRKND
jgi:hypothetical protein